MSVGYQITETLVSTSFYMSSEIHVLFLASHAFVFGITWQRSVNIWYSFVGVARGWRGNLMRCMRYCVCSLRVALWRQPSITELYELCRGYHIEKFKNRRRYVPRR